MDHQNQCQNQKNVIDPEFTIENYGADSVRLFILSDSPPEKDIQWSDQGMISSYKFIQKLWLLHKEIKNKIEQEAEDTNNIELERFVNQIIFKITNNLEKFNYNVIIANLYETYNYFIQFVREKQNIKGLSENYKKIIICFLPIIPHFANECLEDLKLNNEIKWPIYSKNLIENEEIQFVVQINGRKRSVIKIKKDSNEEEIMKIIENEKIQEKYFKNNNIKKKIFVKNRLINILINE